MDKATNSPYDEAAPLIDIALAAVSHGLLFELCHRTPHEHRVDIWDKRTRVCVCFRQTPARETHAAICENSHRIIDGICLVTLIARSAEMDILLALPNGDSVLCNANGNRAYNHGKEPS